MWCPCDHLPKITVGTTIAFLLDSSDRIFRDSRGEEGRMAKKMYYDVRALCIIFLLIGLVSEARADTYFIDFVGGSDSNAGTSAAAPFKHAPGDPNASGIAGSKVIASGDTVIFKGGVAYKGRINIDWSGLNGSPITYDGNSSGTWGNGNAIVNNQNDVSLNSAFFATGARSNIIIRNFTIKDVGGYTDAELSGLGSGLCPSGLAPRNGTAIDFSSFPGSNNITIQNCLIEEIGEWHNATYSAASTIAGSGIALENTKNVIIDNVEVSRTKIGISVKAGSYGDKKIDNILIKNSNLHDHLVWGVDVAPRATGATISNIAMFNNKIHDYYHYDAANWVGCGEKPHTDGIFLRTAGIADSTWDNIIIHSNEFYNDWTIGGGTASIYLSQGASANIFNNTFVNTLHGRTIAVLYSAPSGTSPQVVRIYNNTFFNAHTAINLRNGEPNRTVYIRNNIFYDTRATGSNTSIYLEDANSDPTELNNNHYYTFNTNSYVLNRNGGYLTINQLKANYSWETNNTTGLIDPKFVDISFGLGGNSSKNNLILRSDSPCIDKGVDLGLYLQVDKLGIARPIGGGWEMGAFEFTGSMSTLKIPEQVQNVMVN